MKKNSGTVFSLAEDNKVIPGCTVSELLSDAGGFYTSVFALGAGTDISPEIYGYPKIWYVLQGEMKMVLSEAGEVNLTEGSVAITPTGTPVGSRTENGAVYLEITLKEDTDMNSILKSSEVFALKDLVPYQDGKIVNMDLVNDPSMKFVVMSREDLDRAREVIEKYNLVERGIAVYLSPVFGAIEPREIVEYMIEHKMNGVTNQLQQYKFIWPPDARGV